MDFTEPTWPTVLKIDYRYLFEKDLQQLGCRFCTQKTAMMGYFKKTTPVVSHACKNCGIHISPGCEYYCELYPKWEGKEGPGRDFAPVKLCVKCAVNSPGLKDWPKEKKESSKEG
jgi:hypothetical protein